MRSLLFIAVLASFIFAPAMAVDGPVATTATPDAVVQQTASQMLAAINSKRDELKKNPQELYGLIANILLPHFDLGYATRLVLGPYWRTATPAQRQAFQEAFYKYLIHSYSDGLLQGNFSENNFHVDPWHSSGDETHTMVRSKVMRGGNAPPVQVDYAMIHTKDGWKAFDVSIEGISYVMNYRNQFGPEIQQKGIDELIKRLNTDAEKPAETQIQGAGS